MDARRVKISDVRPNEKNPRADFSSVDRLAENLKATGGEPINPIVVLPDGNGYRIVDGERRWRAMEKNGLEECTAIVCDGWDEADEVLAALASDEKEPLTELEKSRGLQEFMDLGDESRIEAAEIAAGFEVGTANRIKRVRKAAGERAATMSIDQLLAAHEFEDDPDAVERILSADDWKRESGDVRKEKRIESGRASFMEAAAKAGVDVVVCDLGRASFECRPDGSSYVARVQEAEGLEKEVESANASGKYGRIVLVLDSSWYGEVCGTLYGVKSEEANAEDEARRERLDRLAEMSERIRRAQDRLATEAASFVLGKTATGEAPNISSFPFDEIYGETVRYEVDRLCKDGMFQGVEGGLPITWMHGIMAANAIRSLRPVGYDGIRADVSKDLVSMISDFESSGFDGGEDASAIRSLIEEAKALSNPEDEE